MVGFVSLLGAGPGDSELITVKGVRRLKEAEVLVYDRLVNYELFKYVSPTCEMIDVGKKPGQDSISQEEIEDILIDKAQSGCKVVRLKSGDPYVFGRGGEEAQSLLATGIPFEVVPGLSSALAGPSYAGVPLTFRDVATSFHVFTGHLMDEKESLNWEAISQIKGTLVFLMGMKNLSAICRELMDRGYSEKTPVAIIEWATHPQQRSIDGKLENICDLVAENGFKAPSIIVIGDVVSFRKELNFHEGLPLRGKKILVQETETGRLPHLLRDTGADILTFPARTKLLPNEMTLPDLSKLTGLIFADSNSWSSFLNELKRRGQDIRELCHLKLVALGHHAVKKLEKTGMIIFDQELSSDYTELVTRLAADQGTWLVLGPDYRKEELETAFPYPLQVTHSMDFDQRFELGWKGCDVVCLPNSLSASHFVAWSDKIDDNLTELPIIVMGASTRKVLETSAFTNIIETDDLTLLSMRDKACQILGR